MSKRSNRNNKGSISAAFIKEVTSSIESDYVGTFVGDDSMDIVEEWIPSSSKALNYIMGDIRYGAFPMGRIIELFGKRSSGKSLIMYDAGVNVQRIGGIFILIDTESSFSKPFGRYLGIDFNKFIYAHIRTIEEVTDFITNVINTIREKDSNCPVLIGWDSIAAATTLKEEDEDDLNSKAEMGARAKLLSKHFRKIGGLIYQENITYIIINQIRQKIGIMFGSPITTPGGEAAPFHSSIRLQVTRTKKIVKRVNKVKKVVGHKVKAYVEKSKVRPPFGECELDIYVDRVNRRYGIDEWSGLIELLEHDGIIIPDKGKSYSIVGTDVVFKSNKISEYWEEYILPMIPEDLYCEKDSSNS